MTEHVCQCRCCRPDAFPSGPRQDEHHVAVRFGDAGRGTWRCTLDGREISNEATELYAGRDGWAVLFSQPLHVCRTCRASACQYVAHGVVVIARTVPA